MRSPRSRRLPPLALVALAALVALVAGSPASAQEVGPWAQFQGGAGHPGAIGGGGPAPPYRQAWRFTSPDGSVSGAVIVGRVAIAVGARTIYGIDVSTGEIRWTLFRNGGPVSIPAVGTAGGRRILAFVDQAPGAGTSLVGVDLGTKKERWRTPLEGSSVSGVTIQGSTAYVGDVDGTAYAVDLSTGAVRWTADAGGRIDGPLAVASGRVVVSARDAAARTATVSAFDAADGGRAWSFSPPAGSATVTIPAADGQTVVVASGDRIIRGLATGDGHVRWTAVALSLFSPASGAAMDGSTAFVADASGGVYRVDVSDGSRIWDHQLNELAVRSSPVVSGPTVLIGLNDGRLVALRRSDGNLVWQGGTSAGLIGAIALSPQVAIAVKGGPRPGLVAFEHDPEGHLVDVASPTVPQPGTLAENFAVAFVVCLLVLSVPLRIIRRRFGWLGPPAAVGDEPDEGEDEDDDQEDEEP